MQLMYLGLYQCIDVTNDMSLPAFIQSVNYLERAIATRSILTDPLGLVIFASMYLVGGKGR